MKRIIFGALVATCAILPTYAQNQPGNSPKTTARQPRSAEERAQAMTKYMAKFLTLNADQTAKVEAINLDKAKKLEAVRGKQLSDRHLFQEARAINEQWDTELKAVLTPEQYTQYEAKKKEIQETHREKMQARRKR